MTDYKQLCAELHVAFNTYAVDEVHHALLERVRVALAQPEPEGPTLDDIWELCEEHEFVLGNDGANEEESASGLWVIARAVLARWGTPNSAETRRSLGDVAQPIPVKERLPGPGDCDAEGRCWYGAPDRSGAVACWDLEYEPATDDTHWLPAHALPVPTHTSENV